MHFATAAVSTILLGLLLMLSACNHIKVVAFDKRQNTVIVQGGKWASEADYQQAADQYCMGPATLMAMDETTVGSYTTAQAQRSGNTAYAQAVTTSKRRYNKTYSCDAP